MGKYLDIARKLEEQKADSLGSQIEDYESFTLEPIESNDRLDLIDHLTEAEREYYLSLVDIMQTSKLGMDRETTEREAGAIIARNRHPLQVQQATQDYQRYGYVKIFSTVLGKAVYLAKDQMASMRAPDQNIPIFLESDIKEVKGLTSDEARLLLEARILFGGPVKVEDNSP